MTAFLYAAVFCTALLQLALLQTDPAAFDEAVKALQEALSAGGLNPILAVVAGVAVVGLLVLKALGRSIPLVDPLVKAAIDLARRLTKKAPPPEAAPGASNVVELQKLGKDADDK